MTLYSSPDPLTIHSRPHVPRMKNLADMTEPELSCLMKLFAEVIQHTGVSLGVGCPNFVLLVFNNPKIAQYVSNCDRKGIIEAMLECAIRLHNKEDVTRNSSTGGS